MNTTAFDDASPDAPSGGRETSDVRLPTAAGAWTPASSDGRSVRSVHFHDPHAPRATMVVPSVFVAVRGPVEQLLLVRRCDSGSWELPGGRVDVGESAMAAALRETTEESAVQAQITGLVGIYTDPEHVVRAVEGSVRQQFVVVFRARTVGGTPSGDGRETCEAMWVAPQQVHDMNVEPPVRRWVDDALRLDLPPRLA
jgi:8-oxo-dGTP diphosphatase